MIIIDIIFFYFLFSLFYFKNIIGNELLNNDNNIIQISSFQIINNYSFTVYIDYDDGYSGSFMSMITPQNSVGLNVYPEHRFFVKKNKDDIKILTMFTIKDLTTPYIVLNNRLPEIHLNYSSIKRQHPSIKVLPKKSRSTGLLAIFRSLSTRNLDLWYDDESGSEYSYQGSLTPGETISITAYEDNLFIVTPTDNSNRIITKIRMSSNKAWYFIRDEKKYSVSEDIIKSVEKQEKFMNEYYQRTGILWRQSYLLDKPRPPPILYMWPAQEIGQIHQVISNNGYWTCSFNTPFENTCQSKEPLHFELEVVSLAPKVFIIPKFLNHFEADSIINMSIASVKASTVGDYDTARIDDTRTSRNTWIPRNKSPLTETLFRRAADILNVDENLLHPRSNVEDIQVVHYVNGQKYDSHHDWGVSGYHESRYITMLMYLTDQVDSNAGGETSFPKAGTGGGIKVVPVKGDAVLFYNLLEDGNGDDLALHAALPVWRGEKWLANFWVWDRLVG